jgi:hypothetical protein
MTQIKIVRDNDKNEYYLYIGVYFMGPIPNINAKRFIDAYPHIRPEVIKNTWQWTFTNP